MELLLCLGRATKTIKTWSNDMSVMTSTFGGLRLTGEDAANFRKAIESVRPNHAAAESLRLGRKLAPNQHDGRIVIKVKKP